MGNASTEPHRPVASVLVIAADPVIESLVGELVAFAGHRPVFDPAAGAAGEAIRRMRPNVVLLDTSLTRPVVVSCLFAAEEVGTRPILMSSSVTASELEAQADARSVPFFVLPGGPRPLASLIDRTMGDRASRSVNAVVNTVQEERGRGVHPAICAALASVGRARMIVLHAQVALVQNELLRDEMAAETRAARQSSAALKAAVVDYARQLQAANVSEERSLGLVRNALADCAAIVGAEEAMATLLDESADWTREVYHAAYAF